MMKKIGLLLIIVLFFSFAGVSHATLWDRGNGLIYDDSLDITWLQNANLADSEDFGVAGVGTAGSMNPDTGDAWISALNSANYLGYSDWRLPGTDDPYGYGIISGEMQHLYAVDLGNVSGSVGATPGQGSDPVNMSFTDGNGDSVTFENFVTSRYWYDESYPPTSGSTNSFHFYYGHQYAYMDYLEGYMWPVRDGNSIPEPATLLLFGLGGLALAKRRR